MAQIQLKTLAEICHRTATSHAAGVDARTIWKREADRGGSTKRREFAKVSQAIQDGSTISDAFEATGNYLPQLVRDMVHVGERTGRVDEALNRLGHYYEHVRSVRTSFALGILWPTIQFVIAVVLIGFVIWIMGALQENSDMEMDMVGFGLSGTRGVIIYFSVVGAIMAAGYFFIRSLINGKLSAIVMTPLMKVPKVGRWLQVMAMSRMAWALGMAVESGMDANNCVDVALRSTQNRYFSQHAKSIRTCITRGDSLYSSFQATEAFPEEFLDAVRVGEETGRVSESMEVLSRVYEEQGKAAMQAMAVFTGVLVWGFVAAIIIFFIFKFALFYVGMLENVMNGDF